MRAALRGGPTAHFLLWPAAFGGGAELLLRLGCINPPGNFWVRRGRSSWWTPTVSRKQSSPRSRRWAIAWCACVSPSGRRPTLQIMAERRDDAPMTVDDCAADQPLGLRPARRRRSDRRRLYARDQLARHRSAAGSRRGLRPLRRLRGEDRARPADRRPQALPRPAARAAGDERVAWRPRRARCACRSPRSREPSWS